MSRLQRFLWAAVVLALTAGGAFAYAHFIWPLGESGFKGTYQGVTYELAEPRALGLLLAAPLLLWALAGSLTDLSLAQRLLGWLARTAFLLLLALALSHPSRTQETRNVAVIALVDVSDSVSDAAIEEARVALGELRRELGEEDLLRVISFAKRPQLIELGEAQALPAPAELRHQPTREEEHPGAGTNIQAALELAFAAYPPGYLKRLLLFSDGLETKGDLLAKAAQAGRYGVTLFAQPYTQPLPPEIAVGELSLPARVDIGQPFEVVATVYASQPSKARARLFQGETLNGLDGVRAVELQAGAQELKFRSVVRVAGRVTYELVLDELEADTFSENNRTAAVIEVPGRPQVLVVDSQPSRIQSFTSALSAQDFEVDVRSPAAFPSSLEELGRYTFLVVSDVPRESLSVSTEALIERYVRDLGGGFLFAGGAQGFSLGGWGGSGIERLLPVRMEADSQKETPGVALVLVIDRSGSMTGLPMEMAKAACNATVATLQNHDLIEVIAFDSEPVRYVPMQPARYRTRIQNEIARIQPGGGTEIFKPLDMAFQDVSVVQARRKHVILLSDGIASADGLRELAQTMLSESITVTTVGLGDQVSAELMKNIADAGGGRYHAVPDPNSLPRVFAREAELVSAQAAVEDWFRPRVTGSADFLKGLPMAQAPYLHGYVGTQLKPPPSQQILASDRDEPILARGRVGLGWALAWTSDLKNLWGADWQRWQDYGRFWGQLLREHMRHSRKREIPMQVEQVAGEVRAVVDAFDDDERFDNGMVSSLSVERVGAPAWQATYPLRQVAPGRYEVRFPLERYGVFALSAKHLKTNAKGELVTASESYGQVSNPYPSEYASLSPDPARLEQAALLGGGKANPTPAEVKDPAGQSLLVRKAFWADLVLAAILWLLLDLFLRRVRLFDRRFQRHAR